MDAKHLIVNPHPELALPCSTATCLCCGNPEEIDLLRLCSRCGQFVHEAGEADCAGICACDARRKR